jgi:hypothetical protein
LCVMFSRKKTLPKRCVQTKDEARTAHTSSVGLSEHTRRVTIGRETRCDDASSAEL